MGTDARLTIRAEGGQQARRELDATARAAESAARRQEAATLRLTAAQDRHTRAVEKYGAESAQARAAKASLLMQEDAHARVLDRTTRATESGTRATGRLTAASRGMGSAVGGASRQVDRLVYGIGRLGSRAAIGGLTGLTIGVTGMAAAVAKTGVEFNAMKESAELAFTTMLGSGKQARAFLADVQKLAASTPFEMQGLIEGSQRLLAMGFAADRVLPILTAVGDATAGLGGSPEKLDRIITAMGQIQAKGRATAEEFMQLTEAGIPAWDMLARKLGVDIPTAMDMVTKRAVNADTAIAALQEGMTKRFGGLMEKQAKTTAGLWSTLKDTFRIRSAELMEPLTPAIKRTLDGMTRAMNDPKATAGIDLLGRKLAGLVDDLSHIATAPIDLSRKLELAAKRIGETGVPGAVRDAILQGITTAATSGPAMFMDAFMAAPWPAKAVLAAFLLNRFAPGIKLAGSALGKILGGGAAATALGGRGGKFGGATPVWVVNGGGGVGGLPGGGGGGAASRVLGRIGLGGTALATVGPSAVALPAAAGGAAIGGLAAGGIALDWAQRTGKLERVPGLSSLFPSPEQARREAQRTLNAYVEEFRKGKASNNEELSIGPGIDLRKTRDAAQEGIREFVLTWDKAGPKVKQSADGIAKVAIRSLETMGPKARAAAQDTIVRMAASMEASGAAPKGTVQRLVQALTAKFGELPVATRDAAVKAVWELNKIGDKLTTLGQRAQLTALDLRRIGDIDVSGGGGRGRATGGFTPGAYTGRDPYVIRVDGDEAILNPRQQALVPGGRATLERIFAQTGGVTSGRAAQGYARGGYVAQAESFARAQLGEPYVWGGGHTKGDHYGWDCSGFATNVAARVPGYTGGINTTMGLWALKAKGEMKPAKGGEPIVFGMLGMNQSDPRKQHMGVRVNGKWYEAAGGGRGVIPGRSSWGSGLWIPPGLESLEDGGEDGGDGGNPSASEAPPDFRGMDIREVRGPKGNVTGYVIRDENGNVTRARVGTKAGRSARRAVIANARSQVADARTAYRLTAPGGIDRPPPTYSDRIDARHRDDSLQDRQVGDAAEAQAKAGGMVDPDHLAATRQKAVNDVRKGELQADRADVEKEIKRLDKIRQQKVARLRALMRKVTKETRPRVRRNLLDQMAALRDEVRDLWGMIADLERDRSDLDARIAEIDYDQTVQDGILAEPADSGPGASGGLDSDPMLQARADAATDAFRDSDAFVRTAFGAPTIGARQGGRAWEAGVNGDGTGPTVVIRVDSYSLHPGDPTVRRAIADEVVGSLGDTGFVPATSGAAGI